MKKLKLDTIKKINIRWLNAIFNKDFSRVTESEINEIKSLLYNNPESVLDVKNYVPDVDNCVELSVYTFQEVL